MEEKKSKTGLAVCITIIICLVVTGLVGYGCYSLGVSKGRQKSGLAQNIINGAKGLIDKALEEQDKVKDKLEEGVNEFENEFNKLTNTVSYKTAKGEYTFELNGSTAKINNKSLKYQKIDFEDDKYVIYSIENSKGYDEEDAADTKVLVDKTKKQIIAISGEYWYNEKGINDKGTLGIIKNGPTYLFLIGFHEELGAYTTNWEKVGYINHNSILVYEQNTYADNRTIKEYNSLSK